MSKYFLDTEFHEYKKKPLIGKAIDTIELISIGIVGKMGEEYYTICKEFDLKAAWKNEWLKENVLFPIFKELLIKDGSEFPNVGYDTTQMCGRYRLKDFKNLLNKYGKTREQIAKEIIEFIKPFELERDTKEYECSCGFNECLNCSILKDYNEEVDTNPEFYAYYAGYDWVVFCWLFGRMVDLPNGFPMYCNDLKQVSDELYNKKKSEYKGEHIFLDKLSEHLNYPKQINEHNALADARWNKKLYDFLKTI